MNILLLESAYSSYHQAITKEFKGNHYCLLFDVGYSLFNYRLNLVNVRRILRNVDISEADLDFVKNIANLQTSYYDKVLESRFDIDYLETAARYSVYLRQFLSEKSISLVLMHNDLRWQHAIAIEILKSEGIPYFVTERGMVRPYTTTLDPSGVNANSDVVKRPRLYRDYPLIKPLEYPIVPKFKRTKTYLGFLSFLLLSKVGDAFSLNVKFRHKQYSIGSYFKLYLRDVALRRGEGTCREDSLPARYVYFPLQVSGDSQVLIHSDFSSMQEAISVVEKEFYAAHLISYRLVVNLHPMEPLADYHFDERTIVSSAPSDLLIDESDAIVTINSTVGVEALSRGKALHLMGRAYFSDSKYMYISLKGRGLRQSLIKQLVKKELPPKIEDSERFIRDVSMRNQVLGDVYQYDDRLIGGAAAIIKAALLPRTEACQHSSDSFEDDI